jgi:predicted ArsR family transcriptional regulator
MMYMKNNEIQKRIIDVLKAQQPCSFGDLVKELDYSYNEILQNILELKSKGDIQKLNKYQGNYTLV